MKLKTLKVADFTVVHSLKDMPASLERCFDESSFEIADAGQPFNVGCTVDAMRPLPFSRLIFAAIPDKSIENEEAPARALKIAALHEQLQGADCLLHYEQGGIAHFFFLVGYALYDQDGARLKTAKAVWRSGLNEAVRDLPALADLVSAGGVKVSHT